MIFLAVILDIIFILFSLNYVWWYRTKDMKKTRIMMYHMISEQIPQQKKSGLRVSSSMFEKHLEYFSNNGWKFIKMSEIKEEFSSHSFFLIIWLSDNLHNSIDGICDACVLAEKKKREIDWDKREAELRALCEKYRSRNGSYDCLVPGSGGKDSFFAFKLRVLKGFRGFIWWAF